MTSSAVPAPLFRDVIVVGGSAGGVESLRAFVSALPAELPAAVLIVLHLPPTGPSVLPAILARAGALEVGFAEADQPLEPGRILVAPPDRHLVVAGDRVGTTRGPRENGHRPAADVLFRSAALTLGPRVVAVVLSGALDDGTAGARAVTDHGGLVLVQDPEAAAYPNMPQSVLDHVEVHAVGSAVELGALAATLAGQPVVPPERRPDDLPVVVSGLARLAVDSTQDVPLGVPAGFSCPECHGVLYQLEERGLLRFRCRLGHAWSASGLLMQQGEAMENALWMAIRSLDEKASLSRQLADRAGERGSVLSRDRFLEQARSSSESADLVRQLIDGPRPGPTADDDSRGADR